MKQLVDDLDWPSRLVVIATIGALCVHQLLCLDGARLRARRLAAGSSILGVVASLAIVVVRFVVLAG